MKIRVALVVLVVLIAGGCAQVPKEAVELSSTVGKDIAVAHKAHAQLATVLFEKMKSDVNRFVDNVYAPNQIRAAMLRQKELADSSDPDKRKKSLLLAIHAAFKPGASEQLQAKTLKGMESLVTKIRKDVEKMRKDLLGPLEEQEKTVLGAINRSYQQIHYANSIVTGHLASVVKVHEVQSDLLAEFGVEKDLRKVVGEGISNVSGKITGLVDSAENIDEKIENAEETARSLKATISELDTVLNGKKEGGNHDR